MAISGPQPFWKLTPYNDPGSLMGGIRQQVVTQNSLQADAFRSGAQSQRVSQAARSQSGAQTTNDQTQTVDLSQGAVALNQKRANIDSERQILISDAQYVLDPLFGGGIAPLTADLNTLQLDTFIDDGPDPSFGTPIIDPAVPVTANTLIPGDEIFINGSEPDGTLVSDAFTYGVDGTTVGDLVTFIDNLYTDASADYALAGEDEGRIRLQADYGGDFGLSIDLTNEANYNVANGVREIATFSETAGTGVEAAEIETSDLDLEAGIGVPAALGDNLTALTNVNGAPFVNGDTIHITGVDGDGAVAAVPDFIVGTTGSTLGDLIGHITANMTNATAGLDGTSSITLTADTPGNVSPDLDLNLASDGGNAGNTNAGPLGTFALTQGIDREAQTSTQITNVGTGLAAVAGDDLNDLSIVNANDELSTGNRLLITGEEVDGDPVSAIYAYTNGDTLGSLLTYISGLYDNSTATVEDGRIVLRRDAPGGADTGLDINLVDPGPNIQLPDFSGRPALPLFSYLAGSDAADDLSRAAANMAQDQGGDQSAFARLNNFEGIDSTSFNNLSQAAQATQTFDVDLDSIVVNTTVAVNSETFFNEARFRQVEVNDIDNSAQAIFTAGQRQGAANDALSQIAVADGGDADNTLTQMVTLVQSGNVLTDSTHNLERHETYLVPRTTGLVARIENNSAINSSASSQEQNLVQSSAGGVNDDATITENGGTAQNLAGASASNTDTVTVANSISVLI